MVKASSRCSVETNSSFMASASRWAASSTRLNSWLDLRRAPRRRPWENAPARSRRCGSNCAAIDADPLQQRPDDAFALGQHGGQQVQRLDLRIAAVGRQRLRRGHGLLGLDRQFVETKCHDVSGTPLPRDGRASDRPAYVLLDLELGVRWAHPRRRRRRPASHRWRRPFARPCWAAVGPRRAGAAAAGRGVERAAQGVRGLLQFVDGRLDRLDVLALGGRRGSSRSPG